MLDDKTLSAFIYAGEEFKTSTLTSVRRNEARIEKEAIAIQAQKVGKKSL